MPLLFQVSFEVLNAFVCHNFYSFIKYLTWEKCNLEHYGIVCGFYSLYKRRDIMKLGIA